MNNLSWLLQADIIYNSRITPCIIWYSYNIFIGLLLKNLSINKSNSMNFISLSLNNWELILYCTYWCTKLKKTLKTPAIVGINISLSEPLYTKLKIIDATLKNDGIKIARHCRNEDLKNFSDFPVIHHQVQAKRHVNFYKAWWYNPVWCCKDWQDIKENIIWQLSRVNDRRLFNLIPPEGIITFELVKVFFSPFKKFLNTRLQLHSLFG